MTTTVNRAPVTVAELVAAIDEQRRGTATEPQPASEFVACARAVPPNASTLLVLGAHPGAGASSVAVAIADALAQREKGASHGLVRLVDAAPQETSGLICAADRELGIDQNGWRIGRRGLVEVHRPGGTLSQPHDLPSLAAFDSGWLVVDAGWPIRDLLVNPSPVVSLLTSASLVLVCRSTVPGVRRAEIALSDLPGRPVVVAVGARRWPGQVRASFGPLLREAYDAGRVALIPADRRLEVNGIEAPPLPKAFAAAVTRLLDLIWPVTQVVRAHRTKE